MNSNPKKSGLGKYAGVRGLFLRIYSGRYNRRCFSNED